MSFALRCSDRIAFKFDEPKYLNSNNLNPNFPTLSSFFLSMLERNGWVHQEKRNELCPALQFRDQTANIRCPEIARPKPCPPFAIKI
jgi:hypothetical protein